jgi:hypothetical protein
MIKVKITSMKWVGHAAHIAERCTEFCSENSKGRDYLGDLGIDGRMILTFSLLLFSLAAFPSMQFKCPMFITMFIKPCHWTLFWASKIEFTSCLLIQDYNIILPSKPMSCKQFLECFTSKNCPKTKISVACTFSVMCTVSLLLSSQQLNSKK